MISGADPEIEEGGWGGGHTWSVGWCGHAARAVRFFFQFFFFFFFLHVYNAQRCRGIWELAPAKENFLHLDHMRVLLRPLVTNITQNLW